MGNCNHSNVYFCTKGGTWIQKTVPWQFGWKFRFVFYFCLTCLQSSVSFVACEDMYSLTEALVAKNKVAVSLVFMDSEHHSRCFQRWFNKVTLVTVSKHTLCFGFTLGNDAPLQSAEEGCLHKETPENIKLVILAVKQKNLWGWQKTQNTKEQNVPRLHFFLYYIFNHNDISIINII